MRGSSPAPGSPRSPSITAASAAARTRGSARSPASRAATTAPLYYTAFAFTTDTGVRVIGDASFVVGTQTQQGSHQGRPVDGAFRVTLVLTGPDCLLAAVHLSLRTPPGPPRQVPDGPADRA